MWGKPPFTIAENCALDVGNLELTCDWYKEKLGMLEVQNDRIEDSGRPFTDLSIANNGTFLSLIELEPGTSAEKSHVIFFTKNLEKAHQWLIGRGVVVEPIANDSGGNRFFQFRDLEGNALEVCVEP